MLLNQAMFQIWILASSFVWKNCFRLIITMEEWVPLALLGFVLLLYAWFPYNGCNSFTMALHLAYHDHDRSYTICNDRGDHM